MLGAQQGWVCVRGSERLPGPGAAPGSAAWVWAGRELQAERVTRRQLAVGGCAPCSELGWDRPGGICAPKTGGTVTTATSQELWGGRMFGVGRDHLVPSLSFVGCTLGSCLKVCSVLPQSSDPPCSCLSGQSDSTDSHLSNMKIKGLAEYFHQGCCHVGTPQCGRSSLCSNSGLCPHTER